MISRRGFCLALEACGLLLAMGAATALCYRHNWRLDMSAGRAYTLSPLARRVIGSLDKPVEITAFVREEDPRLRVLLDLLRRVRLSSPRVSYRVLDLTRNPSLAAKYGVESYGALVLESQGRRRNVTNADESSLLGALISVSRSERRKVYFLTGHGEKRIESSDRRQGMGLVRRALAAKVYDIAEVKFLGAGGVPADASLLVVAGPRTDLLPAEGKSLEAYVRGGGAALVLVDPVTLPVLERTLDRLGIAVRDGLVMDPSNRLAQGEPMTFEVPGRSRHPVVASLESGPVFSGARPLEALSDRAAVESFSLLETGPAAWADLGGAGAVGLKPGAGDRAGPLTVGAGAVVGAASAGRQGRLIVYGDSDFASDLFSAYLGSKDLFLNSVDWLAGEGWLMAAAPRLKRPGVEVFYVTASQQLALFWLSTVVEPLAFLAIGAVIYSYRRRRR